MHWCLCDFYALPTGMPLKKATGGFNFLLIEQLAIKRIFIFSIVIGLDLKSEIIELT